MFHDRLGDPVDLGIPPDGLVERVNHDHLKVLVGRVLNKKFVLIKLLNVIEPKKLNSYIFQIFKEILSP
jgi:hypothetical protein